MTVHEMITSIGLEVVSGKEQLEKRVENGFVGDLLSFVMAHAKEKTAWITVQGHMNTLAVAVMIEASAIILAEGVKPDENMLIKAQIEKIPVLLSEKSSFELACELGQCLKV